MWKRPLATVASLVLIAAGTPSSAAAAPADNALTPVAGTGTAGATGDGGPASQATLNHPLGAAAAADGTLYVADTGNHKVRAVAPDGTIRTVAGTGEDGSQVTPVTAGAKGTAVALSYPTSLAVGKDGTLYIADLVQVRVYALAADGTVSVRAGRGTGRTELRPPMGQPTGLAVAPNGTVYVGDHDNNRVLAVAPDGAVSVVAGNGLPTASAAGGPATTIPVGAPNGLAVDTGGDLWISGGLLLRRLRDGKITTVTAPTDSTWRTQDGPTWPPADAPLNNVQSVSAGADGLYTIDLRKRTIRRLSADGAVTSVAPVAESTFGALGPVELAAGAAPGRPVYIVDTQNSRIYAANASGGKNGTGTSGSGRTDRPVWPYLLGGAVLLALVVAGLLLTRRRAGRIS